MNLRDFAHDKRNHVAVRCLRAAPIAVLTGIVLLGEIVLKCIFIGLVLAFIIGIPVYVIDWVLK